MLGRNLEDNMECSLFLRVKELMLSDFNELTAPCSVICDLSNWCSKLLTFFSASSAVVCISDSMLLWRVVFKSRSLCWNRESWSMFALDVSESRSCKAETALAILALSVIWVLWGN